MGGAIAPIADTSVLAPPSCGGNGGGASCPAAVLAIAGAASSFPRVAPLVQPGVKW